MEEIKKLKALIKEAKNDCWEYHGWLLKEVGLRKSSIGTGEIELQEWEDVGYFEGKIAGFEEAIELLEQRG